MSSTFYTSYDVSRKRVQKKKLLGHNKKEISLRAKTTFNVQNFYFAQILIRIVDKQFILKPFNSNENE